MPELDLAAIEAACRTGTPIPPDTGLALIQALRTAELRRAYLNVDAEHAYHGGGEVEDPHCVCGADWVLVWGAVPHQWVCDGLRRDRELVDRDSAERAATLRRLLPPSPD